MANLLTSGIDMILGRGTVRKAKRVLTDTKSRVKATQDRLNIDTKENLSEIVVLTTDTVVGGGIEVVRAANELTKATGKVVAKVSHEIATEMTKPKSAAQIQLEKDAEELENKSEELENKRELLRIKREDLEVEKALKELEAAIAEL